MTTRQDALVALGANLPFEGAAPSVTLSHAIASLAAGPLELRAVSRFFLTPCFPAGAGPDYVNAAAVFRVPDTMNAAEVLGHLHRIEARFGRRRETRWGMRTLDLDLIAVGRTVAPNDVTQTAWRDLPPDTQMQSAPETLVLPHPRLQDRAFVLVPLCDIAPGWVHPLLGRSLRELAADLPPGQRREVAPM
ncbi:2-amino-4-hydroxy-6-hydroxymethyldihydropteridine diphosphokinase [Roseivivax sp. CAU 1753]